MTEPTELKEKARDVPCTDQALHRAIISAMGWHPSENGPSYFEVREKVIEEANKALASVRAEADAAATERAAKICRDRAHKWRLAKGPCALPLEEECNDCADAIREAAKP